MDEWHKGTNWEDEKFNTKALTILFVLPNLSLIICEISSDFLAILNTFNQIYSLEFCI
jgi:hypothetical protein